MFLITPLNDTLKDTSKARIPCLHFQWYFQVSSHLKQMNSVFRWRNWGVKSLALHPSEFMAAGKTWEMDVVPQNTCIVQLPQTPLCLQCPTAGPGVFSLGVAGFGHGPVTSDSAPLQPSLVNSKAPGPSLVTVLYLEVCVNKRLLPHCSDAALYGCIYSVSWAISGEDIGFLKVSESVLIPSFTLCVSTCKTKSTWMTIELADHTTQLGRWFFGIKTQGQAFPTPDHGSKRRRSNFNPLCKPSFLCLSDRDLLSFK